MIKNTDKKLYSEQFEKATLGQLIQVFDKNEYTDNKYDKIKQLMPDRHRPLVQLLNQYRILSAHHKEVKVTPQIAESILNLSFAFLIDPETCLYDEDYLKCGTKCFLINIKMPAFQSGMVGWSFRKMWG